MRAPNAKLAAMQRLKQRGLKSALRPHVPAPTPVKAPAPAPAHAPGRFVRAMAAPSVESDRPTKRKHSRRSGGASGAVEDGDNKSSHESRAKRSKKRKKKTSKHTESDDGGSAADMSAALSVKRKKKKKKKKKMAPSGGGNGTDVSDTVANVAPPRAGGALDTSGAAASRRGAWVPRSRRGAPAAAPIAAAAAPTTSRSAQAIASARIPPELTRRLKGLFNRLSENNAATIHSDVAKLYAENAHGRAVTTRALTSAVLSICAPHDVAPTGLAALASRGSGGAYSEMTAVKFVLQVQVVPTVAALVAALHFSVGPHVGAEVARTAFDEFAAALAARWGPGGAGGSGGAERAAPALMSPKRNQNLLLLLVYLYSFGVLTMKLILDAVRKLIQVRLFYLPLHFVRESC